MVGPGVFVDWVVLEFVVIGGDDNGERSFHRYQLRGGGGY